MTEHRMNHTFVPPLLDERSSVRHPAAQFLDFEASLRRLGNDRNLLLQLIQFYVEDSPVLLQSLRAALMNGDPQAAESAAHRLKGLAANFTCSTAVSAAGSIEQTARAGELQGVDALMAAVEREFARLQCALHNYRTQAAS